MRNALIQFLQTVGVIIGVVAVAVLLGYAPPGVLLAIGITCAALALRLVHQKGSR